MAQLPGRISIRPLAQFTNEPKTHVVNVHEEGVNFDVKYNYQTMRTNVPYTEIKDVTIKSDDIDPNPMRKNVVVTTEKRQIFEIPMMDVAQANKLKTELEMQKFNLTANKKRDGIAKQNASSRGVMSFARMRR